METEMKHIPKQDSLTKLNRSLIISTSTIILLCLSSYTVAFTHVYQQSISGNYFTNEIKRKNNEQGKITYYRSTTFNTEISSKASSSSPKNSDTRIRKSSNKSNNIKNKLKKESTTNSNEKDRKKSFPSKTKRIKPKRVKSQYEISREKLRRTRQAQYEELRQQTSIESGNEKNNTPSIWGFEALFPEPVWDNEAVYRDLYQVNELEKETKRNAIAKGKKYNETNDVNVKEQLSENVENDILIKEQAINISPLSESQSKDDIASIATNNITNATSTTKPVIDKTLTRMVEDRVYGFRRPKDGNFYFDVSNIGEGAVQFRDGRRVGKPLKVNCDRLTYHAKRELAKGRTEEARELYEEAVRIDPTDGRGYLGLSRVCARRRDFVNAKKYLKVGIANSYDPETGGSNAFLLQALGCLEERAGNLSEAERLYIQAAKERPYHAAAWVALAQLRTRKLRKGAHAGRVCFQSAERELIIAGKPPSSHVYTAWASLEYRKAGNFRRARELFEKAIEIDPKCSAAYLQLGVMEADRENWDRAKFCFETVLMFDQKNSRVLQAYAIMESKRPGGDSRNVIDLFERALKANPKDAGVLQAYALFVVDLGDIDAGRDLLNRATKVDPKHAPAWQAWGVLETRHGTPSEARDVFQQGIWACAQSGGGQSGGRHCARLWQAWGVLESQEEDYAAARRCFSRALDADNRNIAAVTAWASMEQQTGNVNDARSIYERALKRFSGGSDDKMSLWRAYENMEIRCGNLNDAQSVYQRSMRDTMISTRDESIAKFDIESPEIKPPPIEEVLKKSNEVEVISWGTKREFGEGEVWINNGSIEGKVPSSRMNRKSPQRGEK